MKFKGTKGEWLIKTSSTGLFTTIFTDESRVAEAGHYGEQIHPDRLEPSKEEGIANAKLIAASPILLEALLQLIDPLTGLVYDNVANYIGKERAFKIDEAIRKAL